MPSLVAKSLLLLSIVQNVWTQRTTFPPLPTALTYTDGSFLLPNTVSTQQYQNGSQMTIEWQTNYTASNLYLITGQNFNHPYQLLSGFTDTSFTWTVNDFGNNTQYFSFRVVNALGTVQQQTDGGFESGEFWIIDAALAVAKTSTSSFATSTTTPSSSSANTGTTTFTSSPTSASSSTSNLGAASTASPTATPTPTPTPTSSVAVGVGVGVGVGAAAIAAGIFYWLFRRRQARNAQAVNTQPSHMSMSGDPSGSIAPSYYAPQAYSDFGTSSPVKSPVSQQSPVSEMPGFSEPSELPAGMHHQVPYKPYQPPPVEM